MRANTQIHAAIRNIGDSQDLGTYYEGSLSDAVLWLATQLAETTMATRIVIGLGRSKEDAGRGINVRNAGRAAVTDDVKALLDSVWAGDSETSDEPVEGDDYES